MEIKHPTENRARPERARVAKSTGKSARTTGALAGAAAVHAPPLESGGDAVSLTAAGRSLSAASSEAGEAPFDQVRVEEIKAAIAEGRYPIDNRRLAARILEFERLLR